jgi:hypothetical protein
MPYPDRLIARHLDRRLFNKPGDIVADYYKEVGQKFSRQNLIHNFTSIGNSASLHYVPEHTRDGRDNQFSVESFDDFYELCGGEIINNPDASTMKIGEVYLVRSSAVPYFKVHYIVITGEPIMKEAGLRPQDVVIPSTSKILDDIEGDVVLMKLDYTTTKLFHQFHNLKF